MGGRETSISVPGVTVESPNRRGRNGPRPLESALCDLLRRPRLLRRCVLFLCTGNSCRSQMAEGWLRHLGGERFEALSAGVDPHGLNPHAVTVMGEVGIDISANTSDSIDQYRDDPVDFFITVCDRAAESCPLPPAGSTVLNWSFDDPPGLVREQALSGERALAVYRRVRDEIEKAVRRFLEEWRQDDERLDAHPGGPRSSRP